MRSHEGYECELTVDNIRLRLEHAFQTILKLPKDGGQRLKVATYGYVSEFVEAADKARPIAIKATALDITLMDEAIGWPSLIDNVMTRRIVSARSMVHPASGTHMHPWTRLGKLLGAAHKAIQRWYGEGMKRIHWCLWLDGQ